MSQFYYQMQPQIVYNDQTTFKQTFFDENAFQLQIQELDFTPTLNSAP